MAENPCDAIEWSDDILTLGQIADEVCLPCVVRVCEGLYSTDDISTFSLGDLLKIDSCEQVKKVQAVFVKWKGWAKDESTTETKYETISPEPVSIPLVYRTTVRILPKKGQYYVYKSIAEILVDYPRYFKVKKRLTYQDPNTSKSITVSEGSVLETFKHNGDPNYVNVKVLKCLKGKEIIYLPTNLKGEFCCLRDDDEYTIEEIVNRFPLPQVVEFVEPFSREIVCSNIMEALGNLETFDGKMMLTNAYTEKVLVGHYKSLTPNAAEGKFLKRTAFLLPLSDSLMCDIPVQQPLYLDSSDYEFFVAKNFTDTLTGRQIMDGAMYIEFTKKKQVRFPQLDSKEETDSNLTPPPRPPRRGMKPVKPVGVKTGTAQKGNTPVPAIFRGPQKLKQTPTMHVSPVQRKSPDISGISDIDWSSTVTEDDFKLKKEGGDKPGISFIKRGFGKIKNIKPSIKAQPQVTEEPTEEEEEGEYVDIPTYDYPDISKLVGKPLRQKDFSEFTVEELQAVLKQCGMPGLVKICRKECYDGRIFSSFTTENLMAAPFRLKANDLIKLDHIKRGWRPSHTEVFKL